MGAKRTDFIVKRRATGGIKMCRYLIQQQQRRGAEIGGDGAGIGKDQLDEKRLLLSGRAIARSDPLGGIGAFQIGAVRANQCTPRRKIPHSVV